MWDFSHWDKTLETIIVKREMSIFAHNLGVFQAIPLGFVALWPVTRQWPMTAEGHRKLLICWFCTKIENSVDSQYPIHWCDYNYLLSLHPLLLPICTSREPILYKCLGKMQDPNTSTENQHHPKNSGYHKISEVVQTCLITKQFQRRTPYPLSLPLHLWRTWRCLVYHWVRKFHL